MLNTVVFSASVISCRLRGGIFGQYDFIPVSLRSCERVAVLAARLLILARFSQEKETEPNLTGPGVRLSGHANCSAVAERGYFQVLWFSFYPVRI